MAVSKERLEAAKAVLDLLGKHSVTPSELQKLFGATIDAIRTVRENLEKSIEDGGKTATKRADELSKQLDALETLILDRLEQVKRETTSHAQAVEERLLTQIADAVAKIPDLAPFHESFAEIVSKMPEHETPESIREKLESIEEEGEKLSIDAIKDLREILKDLLKRRGGGGGGSVGARELVKSYDLSPSLNGVLKTFAIPGNFTVISVSGTSFPYTFRRLVDYTFTDQAITFTDEIDAAASLATGQTIEVLYVSA